MRFWFPCTEKKGADGMLRVMRSIQVRICESYPDCWKWGREYTEYMNEKFPEAKMLFFSNLSLDK
jgi:hypothetical protein